MGRLTHQTAKIESHSDYRPCVTSLSYIYIYIYIYIFCNFTFSQGDRDGCSKRKIKGKLRRYN